MNFQESVNEFIESAEWIQPEHAPAVAMLRASAAQLDQEVTAALLNSFGLAYRDLRKCAPNNNEEDDSLTGNFLKSIGK